MIEKWPFASVKYNWIKDLNDYFVLVTASKLMFREIREVITDVSLEILGMRRYSIATVYLNIYHNFTLCFLRRFPIEE